jgi:hypothetical protein
MPMAETNWLQKHAEYASKMLTTWPAWKRQFALQFLHGKKQPMVNVSKGSK